MDEKPPASASARLFPKEKGGLPGVPPLDDRFLRAEHVKTPAGMELQALQPAAAPYLCLDANAPELVLLPGLGMDAMGFIRQLPLGAIAELHLFQTPNEGADGEECLGHFARHVEEYITAARLDQRPGGVVLGGCSLGGAISLAVALRKRVKLRGLVLIGTFGNSAHVNGLSRCFGPLLAHIIPLRLSRAIARLVIARTPFFGRVAARDIDWIVSTRVERTRGYYVRAAEAATRQNQIAAARELALPTLVLHGTRDHVLPYAAGKELAETIPGAKLVTLEGAGHALFFTHPDEVNAAIAEFVRQLP
jgi:pimeloyl-ACP methyl ester carboxylesterase